MEFNMGKYYDSEDWADIVPIPQDDGCANPLAAIAYPEEYSEAMSYLRAVMANDEKSDRVLELTEDIIGMNPAHYTVWYPSPCSSKGGQLAHESRRIYRADALVALQKDFLQELSWLNTISVKYSKNFQIWYPKSSSQLPDECSYMHLIGTTAK